MTSTLACAWILVNFGEFSSIFSRFSQFSNFFSSFFTFTTTTKNLDHQYPSYFTPFPSPSNDILASSLSGDLPLFFHLVRKNEFLEKRNLRKNRKATIPLRKRGPRFVGGLGKLVYYEHNTTDQIGSIQPKYDERKGFCVGLEKREVKHDSSKESQ